MWDSHAISTYLIGKYAKNDSLYPKDLFKRAKIDQRLFFDAGVLFPNVRKCNVHIFFKKGYEFTEEMIAEVDEAYKLLEAFLKDDQYMVGNELTVADFACATSVTQLDLISSIDPAKYPKSLEWLSRLSKLSYFDEINTKAIDQFRALLAQVKAINRSAAEK